MTAIQTNPGLHVSLGGDSISRSSWDQVQDAIDNEERQYLGIIRRATDYILANYEEADICHDGLRDFLTEYGLSAWYGDDDDPEIIIQLPYAVREHPDFGPGFTIVTRLRLEEALRFRRHEYETALARMAADVRNEYHNGELACEQEVLNDFLGIIGQPPYEERYKLTSVVTFTVTWEAVSRHRKDEDETVRYEQVKLSDLLDEKLSRDSFLPAQYDASDIEVEDPQSEIL
jgi:hypothetical protein